MKPLMINALFLIFLSAFPGTPARILPEHPLDKLIPLVQSPCIENQSCHFSGRKTVHGTIPTRPPPSPTPPSGASPGKVMSRNFLYGEMADYGRTSRPPPPPPASAPPTTEVSITMPWYGRAAIPPPPSSTSAPPTKETSFTMLRYGRAWTPPPPPSSAHQVAIIGLLLEKSPSSPSLAST